MKAVILTCILFLTSCTQVTSNSTLKIAGVEYRQEKKANFLFTEVDLDKLKWDGLTIDKGKGVPQDVEVLTPYGKIKTE